MLAKLQDQSNKIEKEISETDGILVYVFIDDHFVRAVGSMNVHNSWGRFMPYYIINTKNLLVRKGNFTSGRPFVSSLYRGLGASQILTYFGVGLQGKLTNHHIAITSRIIEESRNIFRREYNSDRFYVLFFPGNNEARRLIPAFEAAGIKYLDYVSLFDPQQKGFQIEYDGHPTSKAYLTVATRLAYDLGIVAADGQKRGQKASVHQTLQIRR